MKTKNLDTRVRRLLAIVIAIGLTVGGGQFVLAELNDSSTASITGSGMRSITGSGMRSITGSGMRSITGSGMREVQLIGTVSDIDNVLGTIALDGVTVNVSSADIDGLVGLGTIVVVSGMQVGDEVLVVADSVSAVSPSSLQSITGSGMR